MQNNIATFDKNKFTPYSIGFDSLFDKLFEMDDHNSNFILPTTYSKRMKITTLLRWRLPVSINQI